MALSKGHRALLSQHLGDLDDALAEKQCAQTLQELPALYGIQPQAAACDAHPDYASSRLAESTGLPLVSVPHHYAHALAAMAEHGLEGPCLALAWDGIGLGDDGSLWGGEFLCIEVQEYRRVASVWPLRLPGGERAVKEPRRAGLAALFEIGRGNSGFCIAPSGIPTGFSATELTALWSMLEKGLNAPPCSSVGRLFDAVAGLLGLCQINQFEGQAATLLEAAASSYAEKAADLPMHDMPAWPLQTDEAGLPRLDWRPWLQALMEQPVRDTGAVAHAFHTALADAALTVALRERLETVILCGGCFQNRLLLELCESGLRKAGFRVFWPQRIPPNDGSLALGQLLAAARQLQEP